VDVADDVARVVKEDEGGADEVAGEIAPAGAGDPGGAE
jgi:hypothetical protein